MLSSGLILGGSLLCSVSRIFVFSNIFIYNHIILGTFASMYKFLLNALPILIPAMNPPKPLLSAIPSSPFDEDGDLEAGPTASRPTSTLEVSLAQRTARLSLSAQAQLAFLRKRTRRWHAALAGALASGVAIMWEKRSRRGTIAQQLFVR
jgi:hypothetical protein